MPRSCQALNLGTILCVPVAIGLLAGCYGPMLRSQSPEGDEAVAELAELEDDTLLVREVTAPVGLNFQKVEGVTLVTRLNGTGEDPAPSSLRSALLAEMQAREVHEAPAVLADPDTALAVVRAYLPPGAQKGDRVDIEVRVPTRSDTASLRGGWAMEARLQEVLLLDRSLRTGHMAALAEGPIQVDALFEAGADEEDAVLATRGRVLGGGTVALERTLGLAMRDEDGSATLAASIGRAINGRFHLYDRGDKRGVATPRSATYIELKLHPRYKHNVVRYLRVVRSVALNESPASQARRMELLAHKLLEPTTCTQAALELEAIGDDAIRILTKGLASPHAEVRFFSAEALAYLDEPEAAETLAQAAREEPAFRWSAFAALASMDHVSASDALTELLHDDSAETRYGAFHAIRQRNSRDPLVEGKRMGNEFSLHIVASSAPAMIHISRARRPEIVLFGGEIPLSPPAFLFAGSEILIRGLADNRVQVSRFAPGEDEDKDVVCDANAGSVIEAIASVGGDYGDVIQALRAAKDEGYLDARLAVDALPQPGREYRRELGSDFAESGDDSSEESVADRDHPSPTATTGLHPEGPTVDLDVRAPSPAARREARVGTGAASDDTPALPDEIQFDE